MNGNKTAVIFGVTGQDGSYLAPHLLAQNYNVVGVKRRTSTNNTWRLEPFANNENFHLVEGDVTDCASVSGILLHAREQFYEVDEVYNLAAQSHVGTSFQQPLYTWDVTAKGCMNILESMRQLDFIPHTKLYHASTSELFGKNTGILSEGTEFSPTSPYAIAKLAAHYTVAMYRDAYGLFGCSGILFNHGSPNRGEEFVERKISKYVAELYHAKKNNVEIPKLGLGNLSAKRDFGDSRDYVSAMHMMLQADSPKDYVVATGETRSIEQLCDVAFGLIGCDYNDHIFIDPQFFRPSEVPHLVGDSTKIREELGWTPSISFGELIHDMVWTDIERLRGNQCTQ